VAARRLRSLVKAHRPPVGKRVRRALRELARETAAARDAEVLATLVRDLAPDAAELAQRFAARRAALVGVRERVDEVVVRVRRRLDAVETRVAGPSFAEASIALARAAADELRWWLAQVHSDDDRVEAHQARIAGKRLRYLLEPLGEDQLVGRLRRLQDDLGDLHDLHVLAAEIEPTDPLAGVVDRRIAEQFAAIEERWLGEASEGLLDAVEALGRRDVEIERKYLLRGLPDAARLAPSSELVQGYLPGDRLRERLRREAGPEGERFWRTVKLGKGVTRTEVEEPTTREIFEAMWPLTEGKRLRKRRYRKDRWEIDEFLDRDLVLAEIELASEDEPVAIPDWLAPWVEREVTGEPTYLNLNLAS
jgi:CYTH domain-containing protein/CHAD domain-containing protein